MRLVLLELGAKKPERRHYYLSDVVLSLYDPRQHFLVEQVMARRTVRGRRLVYVKYRDYKDLSPFYLK